ncbi:MAG TPA: ribosome rescue protein RqcH, partial [Candidatus Lokiarchaeia archaeon]|nr:ribosome rescue protein RqcH [Candidatus Lokiarchaeia archaeon]
MISNIDLFAVVHELKALEGGFVLNVYEYAGDLLLLKLRTKDGKKMLLIDPKKRIHLTDFKYPMPKFPSQFCMVLRKYMKKRRITKVYQHGLDRIFIMELASTEGGPWKFIVELFAGGNYLLLDDADRIFLAKKYKLQKDRRVLAKQEYAFPPARGIDIDQVTAEEFRDGMQNSDADVVRTIARNFNLGGDFAEEVCARAGVPKNASISDVSLEALDLLFQELKTLYAKLVVGEFAPVIICNAEGGYEDVAPYRLAQLEGMPVKEFESFNAALDEYFGTIDVEAFKDEQSGEARQALSKQERILDSQRETIAENEEKAAKNRVLGDLVYAHYAELDELLTTVNKARTEGKKTWEEIKTTLVQAKEMGIPSALIFENFKPADLEMVVNVEGNVFSVSLQSTVREVADEFYQESKKSKKKIEGTKLAMEETEKKISKETRATERAESKLTGLLKQRKRNWYEHFRWFISSENFLVIAGRDE